MEPMTVGEWLLVNLQKRDLDSLSDEERYRSADVYKAVTLRHIEAWHGPGLADLRAIAESEGEENGVSEKWLRKRRGDLVIDGATAAEIDALTMPQFFLALTGRLQVGAPVPPAASSKKVAPSGSAEKKKALAKHKPTPKTRRAIELIQEGQRTDRQIEQLSGVDDVAKVRSRLKNNAYDLTS